MDSSPPPGPSPQLRDFDERLRRIALRIGLAGLAVVAASFLMTAAAGILRFTSYVEAGSYAVILSGMTWAAWKNFHIKQVLHGGLILLFLAYWVFTIGDSNTLGWAGKGGANWPEYMGELLKERSNGRIAVEVHPGQVMPLSVEGDAC